MLTEVMREGFAKVVAELVEQKGFVPPLSVVGVADDGSIFGVRFERIRTAEGWSLQASRTEA